MSWIIFLIGVAVGFVASFFVKDKRYAKLKSKFHEERRDLKAKITEKMDGDDDPPSP